MNPAGNEVLSVREIYKSFGTNKVLKGINLQLSSGEVLALIGGNGAGKSTLMKIIMGIYSHDSGDIFVNGVKRSVNNPAEALSQHIYMVPQEPLLFPNMTVEENILIGIKRSRETLKKELREILRVHGWSFDLGAKAMTLSIAEQQLAEIIRGLLRQSRILILDEPTSALTFDEVNSLFDIIRELQKEGIGIIYITHRMTEVFEIATHVAIMRDGVITVNGKVDEFTQQDLVKGLIEDETDIPQDEVCFDCPVDYSVPPTFVLNNFTGYGFKDINLEVYPGEILGLSGVVGAGRTELARTIFGKDTPISGSALLKGEDVTGLPTDTIIHKGINYVPEDRHLNGLFKILDICSNTTSALLKTSKKLGNFVLDSEKENKITSEYVEQFHTKITGTSQETGSLSGGNQQKVVLARCLATDPSFLILDEPTRGIDAGARGDVYAIIRKLKETGVAILLISSDLEEIVELADRAISIYQGRINGSFSKEEIDLDTLMCSAFDVEVKEEKND